jgi:hypothetical protein
MILHLLATLMFVPSLVAWLQVCHSHLFEWFWISPQCAIFITYYLVSDCI